MVSTRHHPETFDPSPTKTRARHTPEPTAISRPRARSVSAWTHTPPPYALSWLALSIPLVFWDTFYLTLRPHSFPGGKWSLPFTPYKLYVEIDDLYSPEAWARKDGFPASQAVMNMVESAMYFVYIYLLLAYGQKSKAGRKVVGREGAIASVVGFAAFVMTFSKTALYFLVGHFGGWVLMSRPQVPWVDIILLFICTNTPWIIVPLYYSWIMGSEIVDGLEQAAGLPQGKKAV